MLKGKKMEKLINARAVSGWIPSPMCLIIKTGKIIAIKIIKTCCSPSMKVMKAGGFSSTP
jgi:hypothetical protein